MFSITGYAALKGLIDDLAGLEDRLMANELETLRSLAAKYSEPVNPDPVDITCLEVMLRNIEIRKAHNMDPATDGGRVIELHRGKKE